QLLRIDSGKPLNRGKDMGEPAGRIAYRLTVRKQQPLGMGSGRLDRYLLAEHHPHREFGFIDGAWNALPRSLAPQRRELRISGKGLDDGFRIRVEVQQPAAAGDGSGEIPKIVEHQPASDVICGWAQTDDAMSVRQTQS